MVSHEASALWVDDDPFVLSSARRLFRDQPIHLITCEDPLKALAVLKQKEFSLIISDQKMPHMTGIQFLKTAKEMYPSSTRIMVTGFFDKSLLEEAINVSGVFRFINKPWNEQELLSDIRLSLEHHSEIKRNENLQKQIRQQNKELTQLAENLESIIFDRTKEINQSNKDQESKNKLIRNLVKFIQKAHESNDLETLFEVLIQDLKPKFKSVDIIFCTQGMGMGKEGVVLYNQKKEWMSLEVKSTWRERSSITINDKEDQLYLANSLKRPIRKIVGFPLLKSKANQELRDILFLEHDLGKSHLDELLEYMMSRLQILSLAIERILFLRKVEFDSQQWENTFDSIQDPLCIVDQDGGIVRFNSSFRKKIQKTTELENMLVMKVMSRKQKESLNLKIRSITYEVSCFPILDSHIDQVSHVALYYKDITEERSLYEHMIQNEKMAALGLLAGNIAHELNNPLTGIRSLAQLLKLDENIKDTYREDLIEVEKASQRCLNVISGLQDFSKNDKFEFKKEQLKVSDLNEIINRTIPLLKSALKNHNLHLNLQEGSLFVLAQYQVLQQILFNLIINSCQALPKDGGVIEIHSYEKDRYAFLEVVDNGLGVPQEIQSKIFDPFFTTKKEGEGTGLGLSFSKTMIEKMGGKIVLKPRDDDENGSCFRITLPIRNPL